MTIVDKDGTSPLLRVSGVGWRVGGVSLLKNIGFCLKNGESVALLGPNGAGKSSLIRLLAGDWEVSSGGIDIHGRPLEAWSRRELAQVRAVMPQLQTVSFPLRVEEVVALGLPGSLKGNARHPQVEQMLRLLEVDHLRSRRFPTLSGGEQQRVQMARVLAQIWDAPKPPLLLLDECTSALDPAHQHRILQLIRDITRRGVGALWVVHDLNLAARYADRILLMQHGQLLVDDAPDRVLTPDWLAQVYGLRAEVIDHGGLVVVEQGCLEERSVG